MGFIGFTMFPYFEARSLRPDPSLNNKWHTHSVFVFFLFLNRPLWPKAGNSYHDLNPRWNHSENIRWGTIMPATQVLQPRILATSNRYSFTDFPLCNQSQNLVPCPSLCDQYTRLFLYLGYLQDLSIEKHFQDFNPFLHRLIDRPCFTAV